MTTTNDGDAAGGTGAAALLASAAGAAAEGGAAGSGPAAGGEVWWGQLGASTEKAGDRLSDAEWIENKNFRDFSGLVKSMRELETKVGAKFQAPSGPDDKEGWQALRAALGVPDKAEGYQIKMPGAAADDPLLAGFQARAFELGLPPHMAAGIAQWFGETMETTSASNAEAARAELQKSWKGDYDANLEHGRRAMAKLGLDVEAVNGLAAGYGLAPTMELLAKVGRGFAEDGPLPGSGVRPAASAEQLAARQKAIQSDPELRARLFEGKDPALTAEWRQIQQKLAEMQQPGR